MKNILTFLLFILSFSLQAQIRGKIVDKENNAVEAANVVLGTKNNTQIKATVSDKNGNFLIEKTRTTDSVCILTVSFIGYQTVSLELNNISNEINLDKIVLEESQTELDEVTVSAPNRVTQTDRQLYFPNKKIIETSTNGYNLLHKLMIPELNVDFVNKSISSINGDVAVYINDKEASKTDITALLPDEILRVEYIDNPGVRYGDEEVAAVVNFIVKRRYAGIAAGIDGYELLNIFSGTQSAYAKYNYKLSEFTIQYNIHHEDIKNRDVTETNKYTLPDNSLISVDKRNFDSHTKYTYQELELKYNLSQPNKYMFEIALSGYINSYPYQSYKQKVTETNKPDYFAYTNPTYKTQRPSIDIFYRKNLPNKQTFTANIVGTYIDTRNGQFYGEYHSDDFLNPYNVYEYYTDGENFSVIGEARYTKKFQPFDFSSGIKHTQRFTTNKYTGTSDATTKFRTANTYAFAQITGKLRKLNYTLGIGLSRIYQNQNELKTDYLLPRPSLSLMYPITDDLRLRYNFSLVAIAANTSLLSDVAQQADEWRIKRGNPNLKNTKRFGNRLSIAWNKKRFNIENTFDYNITPNAIMEDIRMKTDGSIGRPMYILSYDNQKRFETLKNTLSATVHIIPDVLTIKGSFALQHTVSKGNSYYHTLNYALFDGEINWNVGNFAIGYYYSNPTKILDGETYISGKNNPNQLYIVYMLKNIEIGLIGMNQFTTSFDKRETQNEYYYNMSDKVNPGYKNAIAITLTVNFNKGRQYSPQQKTLNNSDTDAGVFK